MIEFLIGTSLSAAAGLNAWIPLLVLGLANRFVSFVELPTGSSWLSSDIALWVIGILLVLEIIADKVPALDSLNDIVQTAIRPAAGGIVFGAGSTAQTLNVSDPSAFFSNNAWVPIASGVVIALLVHALKAAARPVLNVASAGLAAPMLSTAEDGVSIAASVLALVAPVLAFLAVVAAIWGAIAFVRRRRRRLRERDATAAIAGSSPLSGTQTRRDAREAPEPK